MKVDKNRSSAHFVLFCLFLFIKNCKKVNVFFLIVKEVNKNSNKLKDLMSHFINQ